MDLNTLMPLLPDMAAFVAVVETGSFTGAAEKMGITPSGVSRQVSRLEKALGVILIERTTRRQSTTSVGMAVYEQCRNMLDSAREAVQVSESDATEAKGRLRVAVPKALAKQVLEPYFIAFVKEYPAVSLHLMVTDERLDPARQDLDIVFHVSAEPYEHLVSKVIGRVESVLCASPAYLKERGAPAKPRDLLAHDCIPLGLLERDNHWLLSRGESRETVAVNGRYTNNHSEMRLRAVKEGLGIGIFPDFVVQDALKAGEVERVLHGFQVHSHFQGGMHMQFQPMRFMPAKMRAFIDFMEGVGYLAAQD
ncbi:LysR family transcriptional regulator [Marinobacterium mangrovicola]|uniref:DNA-binding transcriptional LysR family regulator n=1 Tax=Marinobacterium mangrovicola TaxID=1476959 RepID=A0A4R1GWD8_9GAMM|nr:LysR family transcriptional regulator [Marinobacterium mangrovicola]TCK08732.1 DNA-binding transcriptional LysR family regulator [Marinobacterium mangrovicola]